MKILITGGAGYIGSSLVNQLATSPKISEIVIYDNLSNGKYDVFFQSNPAWKAQIRFVQGDILDSRKLKRNLQNIDAVVHLAAKVTTPFSERGSAYFEQVNHWGTAELCYALEDSKVKKLIYLSSASVYGSQLDPANEQTIATPNTAYGFSKLRAEAHISRMQTFMPTSIIRCANTFGYSPCMRFDSVINKFLFKAQQKQIINVNGDGNQTRAFIPIERVVELITKQISEEGKSFELLNLADRNLSVNEIVNSLKVIYPELELIYVNQHLSLRNQILEIPPIYDDYSNEKFVKELRTFKGHFAF